MIDIQYENHSNFRYKPTIHDTISLPSNLPPAQFRRTIVEAMGLDVDNANIVYSITGLVGHIVPHVFNSDPQV